MRLLDEFDKVGDVFTGETFCLESFEGLGGIHFRSEQQPVGALLTRSAGGVISSALQVGHRSLGGYPAMHHILFYDYVDDVLERRGPHRPDHLAHIAAAKEAGQIVMAGPVGDPVHGAVIVFSDASVDQIEGFAATDPYVVAGLVRARRIEPWAVV